MTNKSSVCYGPTPTVTMTDAQRSEFRRYLRSSQNNDFPEALQFALVLAGDKPATLIDPYPWVTLDSTLTASKGSIQLFDLFDLAYREMMDIPGWFVAPTSGRLDLIPTVRNGDCDAYHRRLGVVFGYPEAAIEYYIEQDGERTQPRDLVKMGIFEPSELAYTSLVFYLHDDSEAGYEYAISAGKDTYERLTELADDWELPIIKIITDTVYEYYVDTYSVE